VERITLDPALRARLGNLETEVEFCDESGRTLGIFLPTVEHDPLIYAKFMADVTEEELERARQQPGGRTTAEVLTRMEQPGELLSYTEVVAMLGAEGLRADRQDVATLARLLGLHPHPLPRNGNGKGLDPKQVDAIRSALRQGVKLREPVGAA
jgi:hypothetical protein